MNALNSLKVGTKLLLIVAIGLLGIITFGTLAFRTIATTKVGGPIYASIIADKDLLADILPPPEYVIESYLCSFMLLEDSIDRAAVLGRCDELRKNFEVSLDQWKKEMPDGEKKRLLVDEAAKHAAAFLALQADQFIPAVRKGDTAAAHALLVGPMTTAYDAHRKAIDRLVEVAQASAVETEAVADSTIAARRNVMIAAIVAIILLTAAVSWVIARSLTRPVHAIVAGMGRLAGGDLCVRVDIEQRDELGQLARTFNSTAENLRKLVSSVAESTREVAAAATEIAASAEEMACGLKVQEQQTSQIASTVERASASISEVATKSTEAARAAESSGADAGSGGEIVRQTVDEINAISDQVAESVRSIENLGKRSDEIGRIVGVINEIADQTNLLALNAAIEAARAGENGRGFAVVADEVRKLAERTTKATEEVAMSIRETQSETTSAVQNIQAGSRRVAKGVELATSAGSALERIVTGTRGLNSMVQTIAGASEQQSAAIEEICRGITAINAVSRESAEGATQASNAASQLSSQAERLQTLVTNFKI